MDKFLTLDDIDEKIRPRIYVQQYPKEQEIDGVKIVELKNMADEAGEFLEILRFNKGEVLNLPGFQIAQINRSILYPHAVKAWHLHFKQDEFWYVSCTDHLLVGLWDLRKDAKTNNHVMKIVLGGGRSRLLYIPKGVAHGSANIIGRPVAMWYFANQQFDSSQPDEQRINWDAQGKDFWSPTRD